MRTAMRNITSFLAAGLLLTAVTASAQQQPQPLPATTLPDIGANGVVAVGLRFNDLAGDPARYQRYRDYQDGMNFDQFRFDQKGETWFFRSGAEHVGRNDQYFFGDFVSGSKVKGSFSWNQIPLYVSGDTRTPYTTESVGVLRLDDSMRALTQAGKLNMSNYAARANLFAVDSYRHIGTADLLYNATPELAVKMGVTYTQQKGTMPFGATFGFNNDIEIAAPVDRSTTDVNAGLEWANRQGMVRVGYEGSWFTQNIDSVTWDNPLTLTDSTNPSGYVTGNFGGRGRAALPPSNSLQGITTAGALKLPGASRVTGTITIGDWRQNAQLLPITVNTSVPNLPLPRETAEANARTLAMNYTFTSRPNSYLWLSARYRYYDFDNRTPAFQTPLSITFDQTVATAPETEALGYKRHNIDLDVSVTPVPFTAVRAGYSRADNDRTYRIFEKTIEDSYHASLDSTFSQYVTFRAMVERSQRRGSGFDEELLIDAGEQPDMRHFDVADRNRDRVTGLVQVMPHKWVGFSASYSTGKDNYLDSGFGLRDSENNSYSVSADVGASDRVAANVFYTNEAYTSLQTSRYATLPGSPQVTDPNRDWETDADDHTKTIGGALDLLKVVPKTEIRLLFDRTKSDATYVYRTAPGWPTAPLLPLPPVKNELRSATADLRYFITRRVAIGVLYWYEDYAVADFTQSPDTLNRLDTTGSLFLGYLYRPYTISSAAVRLICSW